MNKKWLTIGCVAALVVFILGVGLMTKKVSNDKDSSTASASSSQEVSAEASSVESPDEENADAEATDKKEADSKDKKKDKKAEEEDAEGDGSIQAGGFFSGGNSSNASASDKNKTETSADVISLPYTMPGSNLVLENISSYDGEFVEDGSDAQVSNVAVAVFRNNGSTCLEFGAVKVKQGDRTLEFEFSTIGSGDRIAVLEKNAQQYSGEAITSAIPSLAEVASFEMSASQVKVEELEGGDLQVTNISGQDIPCVRIFYKFYMADQKAYVGGITYNSKITDLKAGKTVTVTPSHYKDGSSRVVMVRTYDSAD